MRLNLRLKWSIFPFFLFTTNSKSDFHLFVYCFNPLRLNYIKPNIKYKHRFQFIINWIYPYNIPHTTNYNDFLGKKKIKKFKKNCHPYSRI